MKGLLFTYVLTYGGAIVSLFNPYYGLLIYICFAIVYPPALWPWSVPVSNYSRIIGIAFLMGWAINGFGDRSLGRARPIVVALLGYFLWVTLSTIFSPKPELGFIFVEYLAKIVLPFVAGVTLIHTVAQLRQLMWVIVASCGFLAYETNLAYLDGYSVQSYGFLGMDNNTYSILMVASFGLALVLSFEELVAWRRYLCFGVAAAMAHVPMLAFSRGGMFGTLIASGVALVVIPKSKRTWFMIGATVVGASILAGPSVVERFSTTFNERDQRDESAQSRLDLWRDCTTVAIAHPLLGVGQSCWRFVTESYGWPAGKEAHSLWFQTAAELGFPGVAFLMLFYYRSVAHAWRAGRDTNLPWMQTLSRMVMVSLVGFAVSANFVTVSGFELPYYIALLGTCGLKIAYQTAANVSVELSADEQVEAAAVPWQEALAERLTCGDICGRS